MQVERRPEPNCCAQLPKLLQCGRGVTWGCACAQTAQTLYTLRVMAAVSSGTATAGVAFFAADKTLLRAPAIDLEGASAAVRTVRISAPQGAMAASVFVGKFDSTGGHLQARALAAGLLLPPASLPACEAISVWQQQPQADLHSSMLRLLCSASLRHHMNAALLCAASPVHA